MKEIVIEADIKNLDSVLDFIGREMEEKNICAKLQNNIKIACEEIFVNIALYGYTLSKGDVIVKIDTDNEVIIEFEDSGVQYNPLEKEDPDITASIEERDIGGLGIFMVKKLMDIVEYKYENNKNILRMKKIVTQQ